MKPIYKINRKDLKFPRECYSNLLHRVLGVQSPARCWAVIGGAYGEEVAQAYTNAYFNSIRWRVNKRKATKAEYQKLRREERRLVQEEGRP